MDNLKKSIVFVIVLLLELPCQGQETIPESTKLYPKVAVVLSGGAAYGMAHVGVLKVIEEAGIPVDMIIGNSMGSLIGGLYASGYSPGDIEDVIASVNWMEIFSLQNSDIGKRLLDELGTVFTISFDQGGVANRNGLLADQNITGLLSRLTYKVSMINDFEELPIPFRTVAVDLLSGQEVVLDKGIPYQAMRASMSIPLVFPPVDIDDHYLVDGGLRNNNPIDLAVKWGADIILDVHVGAFFSRERKDLDNLLDILDQTSRLIGDASYKSVTMADKASYRLNVDLRDFSRSDFGRFDEIVRRGEVSARDTMEELKALGGKISRFRELEVKDWRREGEYHKLPVPAFKEIRFEGPMRVSQAYIDSLFLDFFNTPADLDKLEQHVEILRRRGGYETIGYHLEETAGGCRLVLRGNPGRARQHDLTFGLNFHFIAGKEIDMDANTTLSLNLRDLWVPRSLIQMNIAYQFTQGPEISLSYSHPVFSFLSIEPAVEASYKSSRISASRPKGDLSRYLDLRLGANILFHVRDWWDFYLSYRFFLSHYESLLYTPGDAEASVADEYNGLLHLAGVGTEWNSRKSSFFVQHGFSGHLKLEVPFAGRDLQAPLQFPWFDSLEFYHRQFYSPTRSRTFFADLLLTSYRGPLNCHWALFSPGGERGIPGYYSDEGYGRDGIIAGLGYVEEIRPLTKLLGFDTFFLVQLRGGNVWKELSRFQELKDLKAGVRTGLEIQLPVGTLFAGLGVSLEGDFQFNLFFN